MSGHVVKIASESSLILVAASPEFDPLRNDPRFRTLLDRMGLGQRAA